MSTSTKLAALSTWIDTAGSEPLRPGRSRVTIELRALAVALAYWLRPFDMLVDSRRWRWEKRTPCGRQMAPEWRAAVTAAVEQLMATPDLAAAGLTDGQAERSGRAPGLGRDEQRCSDGPTSAAASLTTVTPEPKASPDA